MEVHTLNKTRKYVSSINKEGNYIFVKLLELLSQISLTHVLSTKCPGSGVALSPWAQTAPQ